MDATAPSRRLIPYAVAASVLTIAILVLYQETRRAGEAWESLRAFDWRIVPVAFGLHVLMQVWWALRLRTLGAGLGVALPYPPAHALVSAGLFAAAVTPGRIGSEPARIALLMRRGASGAAASRLVLADRAADMVYFLVAGTAVAVLLPAVFGTPGDAYQWLAAAAVVALAALVAVVILILVRPAPLARLADAAARRWDRLRRREAKSRDGRIHAFFADVTSGLAGLARQGPLRLLAGSALAVLLWSTEFTVLYVVVQAFGHDIPYGSVYAVGVLVALLGSIPLGPGGSGLVEIAALALLLPLAPGLSASFLLVWRGLTFYMDLLIGGIVAGAVFKRWRPARGTPEPADAA